MHSIQSESEISAIVNGFELCQTEKTAFKHHDHLVVAVVYLNDLSVPEAIERMRASLMRFIKHHQVDERKYNETITVFWVEVVAEALEKMPASFTLTEKCNTVLQEFPNAAFILDHYSSELLFSDEARANFVKPDLKNWKVR
jgi:hypothetical protein